MCFLSNSIELYRGIPVVVVLWKKWLVHVISTMDWLRSKLNFCWHGDYHFMVKILCVWERFRINLVLENFTVNFNFLFPFNNLSFFSFYFPKSIWCTEFLCGVKLIVGWDLNLLLNFSSHPFWIWLILCLLLFVDNWWFSASCL